MAAPASVLIPDQSCLHLLVVDSDEISREICYGVALQRGLAATCVTTTGQAFAVIEKRPVDIVICDSQAPEIGGLELSRAIREDHPHTAVILTHQGPMVSVPELAGASGFVLKPLRAEDLRRKIARVVRLLEIDREKRVTTGALRSGTGFGNLMGTSPGMEKVYRLIDKLGDQDCPVLILGESGTGKELVAKSIHEAGPRKNKPFVTIDCTALAPTLIESELFGHVRGAFTGATQGKAGLLESANGGTIFLDEIGDLPLNLQAKLLRAVQNHEVRAVGANLSSTFNARVIAATNHDLDESVRTGKFRQDLFFRINVVQIKMPPLRWRKDDIQLLATKFLDQFRRTETPVSFSVDALKLLMEYQWPGNVRELENAIERAVALGAGEVITPADLPIALHYRSYVTIPAQPSMSMEEIEKQAICKALRDSGGDKIAAARVLGIGKTTLYRKLKQYERAEVRLDRQRRAEHGDDPCEEIP